MLEWDGRESYRNIVYKVTWALAKVAQMGIHYKYLIKADDDSFINVANLDMTLAGLDPQTMIYGGECLLNKEVQRKGKYKVGLDEYSDKTYPGYAAGAGYVLSKPLVDLILQRMWRVEQFRVEDAFIGYVISLFDVEPVCWDTFFHRHWEEYCGEVRSAVVLHYVKPEEQIIITKLISS